MNLPEDPSLELLDAPLRAALAARWQARAVSERMASESFATLAHELEASGTDPVIVELARGAVGEEMRHAELCAQVAARYRGSEARLPAPGGSGLPAVAGHPPELRLAVRVAALSCIQESIACAWLAASLEKATSPLARAATRALLEDEVDHARLGWAFFTSLRVKPATRVDLAAHLPLMLGGCLRAWVAPDRTGFQEGCPEHAALSDESTRRVTLAATREVVLAGFDAVGLPTASARTWLAAQENPR